MTYADAIIISTSFICVTVISVGFMWKEIWFERIKTRNKK